MSRFLLAVSLSLAGTTTGAATIDVTRLDDPPPDGCALGGCSLREAVAQAALLAGHDVIALPAGEYVLAPAAGVVTVTIESELTIAGAGSASTVIRSAGKGSMFLARHHATFRNLTLRDGVALGDTLETGFGGAIRAQYADVRLSEVTFTNNLASYGGAVAATQGGSLDISGSTFSGNTADIDGGALEASAYTVSISGSTFSGNRGKNGGAVFATHSPLTLAKGSRFIDNEATAGGGAVAANFKIEVDDTCEFSGNRAQVGGAFYGIASLALRGVPAGGSGLVRITGNEALIGGAFGSSGSIELERIDAEGNLAEQGGALYQGSTQTLEIVDSRFADNVADDWGGAIVTWGTGELTRVSLQGNVAGHHGGAFALGNGGNVTLANVDVFDNRAPEAAAISSSGTLALRHVTIGGNQAGHAFDAIRQGLYGTTTYANSVLAGRCTGGTSRITALGRNLRTSSFLGYDCAGTSVTSTQLALRRGTFGGLFEISGTASSSSAIVDGGSTSYCVSGDIRNRTRDAKCDYGAFEFGAR